MTDLPRWYPEYLIREVDKRRRSGPAIHTLVLWTKFPTALVQDPLAAYLKELKRAGIALYAHITVTGMGRRALPVSISGKPAEVYLEKAAPKPDDALAVLPDVIGLLGSPDRIRLRIDPLLYLRCIQTGDTYTNEPAVYTIAGHCGRQGITKFTISFVAPYAKVTRRFSALGWALASPPEGPATVFRRLAGWIADQGGTLTACAVSGLPPSRCIDAEEMMALSPSRGQLSLREPRRREHCHCHTAIDIGGWPPKICPTGCLYCYARPDIR